MSADEYLLQERCAHERHQYWRGEVARIQGGSATHSALITNVIGELGSRLKGGLCRVYDGNLRIGVPGANFFTYTDAIVVCGEIEFDPRDDRQETVLNPTLVVEVLSPSTEVWDRGGKLQNYIQIDSLREYVLVSSQVALVETFFRQFDRTWAYVPSAPPATAVKVRSLNIELPFAEIYAGVTFPPRVIDVPQGAEP